jgi:hypothetical protein
MAENNDTPDQPENLVLVYLRRIDARLDGFGLKFDEVISRLSACRARGRRSCAAISSGCTRITSALSAAD